MAIKSFARKEIEDFFFTGKVARREGWRRASSVAARKLDMLDYAHVIDDLRVPPGNRLERLRGDRKGFWSIRINDQWRIVFRWKEGATDVDIVDYH